MSPFDLINGKDNKIVLSKLQAACFHLLLFATVAAVTTLRLIKYFKGGEDLNLFDGTMWSLYAAVAVGHAVIDKTGTQVKDFKDKQLETETRPAPL